MGRSPDVSVAALRRGGGVVPIGVAPHSAGAAVEDGRADLDLGVGEVVRGAVVRGVEARVGGRGRRRGRYAVGKLAHLERVGGPISL